MRGLKVTVQIVESDEEFAEAFGSGFEEAVKIMEELHPDSREMPIERVVALFEAAIQKHGFADGIRMVSIHHLQTKERESPIATHFSR